MPNVITLGMVLKRSNFGESNRLLVLFTEQLGKVSAVANGARKNSSKFGGHLEPGAVVQFELASGKSLYTVRSAKIVTAYQFNDLSAIQQLFIWLELIDRLIRGGVHSQALFALVMHGIAVAAQVDAPYKVACAELELYSSTGYELVLDRCAVGQEPLVVDVRYLMSAIHGGAVCHEHCTDRGAVNISNNAIKVLRLVQARCLSQLANLVVPVPIQKELADVAHLQRDTILERGLRSAELTL